MYSDKTDFLGGNLSTNLTDVESIHIDPYNDTDGKSIVVGNSKTSTGALQIFPIIDIEWPDIDKTVYFQYLHDLMGNTSIYGSNEGLIYDCTNTNKNTMILHNSAEDINIIFSTQNTGKTVSLLKGYNDNYSSDTNFRGCLECIDINASSLDTIYSDFVIGAATRNRFKLMQFNNSTGTSSTMRKKAQNFVWTANNSANITTISTVNPILSEFTMSTVNQTSSFRNHAYSTSATPHDSENFLSMRTTSSTDGIRQLFHPDVPGGSHYVYVDNIVDTIIDRIKRYSFVNTTAAIENLYQKANKFMWKASNVVGLTELINNVPITNEFAFCTEGKTNNFTVYSRGSGSFQTINHKLSAHDATNEYFINKIIEPDGGTINVVEKLKSGTHNNVEIKRIDSDGDVHFINNKNGTYEYDITNTNTSGAIVQLALRKYDGTHDSDYGFISQANDQLALYSGYNEDDNNTWGPYPIIRFCERNHVQPMIVVGNNTSYTALKETSAVFDQSIMLAAKMENLQAINWNCHDDGGAQYKIFTTGSHACSLRFDYSNAYINFQTTDGTDGTPTTGDLLTTVMSLRFDGTDSILILDQGLPISGTGNVLRLNGTQVVEQVSSRIYKKHIQDYKFNPEIFLELTPKIYNFKSDNSESFSFIAEDIEDLCEKYKLSSKRFLVYHEIKHKAHYGEVKNYSDREMQTILFELVKKLYNKKTQTPKQKTLTQLKINKKRIKKLEEQNHQLTMDKNIMAAKIINLESAYQKLSGEIGQIKKVLKGLELLSKF